MLVGFVETKNLYSFFLEKKIYIYYLVGYSVSCKISGGRISGQNSFRYSPNN